MVFKTYLVWNTFLVMVPAGCAYVEQPAVFTDNPNISFELPF